ncbi:MAG TPA: DUF3298 domain-containing protein [Candidatus Paceibacterota bacterium]|nr:DUF3298 domain-containing protein [Candidatus Paceibacterota bacterium]
MRRDLIIGIIALVVLGGGVLYLATRPAPVQAPAPMTESGNGAALPAGKYVEHAQYYDIAANYPTTTPLAADIGAQANAAAVADMRAFIAATIGQFKTDGNFANLTPKDISMMGLDQGRTMTLGIEYLISSSPHTVSYIFTIYEDTLGAHGNTFFHTFTFDTSTGATLALGDLFTTGSDYPGTISTIARAELPAIIGTDMASTQMLDDGTAPDAKNFENFFIDNGRLGLLFAPYAVAPYAAGPQTLYIPLANLANILKPEYRPQ